MRARGGFVLVLVLVIALMVAALAMAAMTVGTSGTLVAGYYARESALARAADAGLELGRARLNSEPDLYPDSGFVVLEDATTPVNADGTPVPGLRRSIYVGPIGVVSGQYGVLGAVVSVARDDGGGVAVRRLNVPQESFSKFAYFTDVEPDHIAFGGGDQLFGPVHSNDDIRIYPSGATFFSPVTTGGRVRGTEYASFREGYREGVARIPLPELADVLRLRTQAAAGGTAIDGNGFAPPGRATTRLEFLAIDLNDDGDGRDPDEGFVRVYQSADAGWVVGAAPPADLRDSRTCGHWHLPDSTFVAAVDHPSRGPDSWVAAVTSSTRACYLGGAPELFGGFVADDGRGRWLAWDGAISGRLAARDDRAYLFPITRPLNPEFKGVIFVDGDVAVSGELRGRVTVAATGDIVVADDITYTYDPATASCLDILGLFAGGDIVVADTPLLAPWQRGRGAAYFSYGATTDEFIHAFLLPLNTFRVDGYDRGSTRDERCQGERAGRGCLYVTGGIIQATRGPVGQITRSGISGYIKRYGYDTCGLTDPPPYFPTTGHFDRGTYYQVDPTDFDPDRYFDLLAGG